MPRSTRTERTPTPTHFRRSDGPKASQPQLNYIRDLMEIRDITKLSDVQIGSLRQPDEFWDAETTRLSKMKAGRIIDSLKALPYASKDEGQAKHDVFPSGIPDGRYAIPKDDGTLMFYSVKEGRYTTFVDVWASDARWPIKNKAEKIRILTAIAEDPRKAMNRFGTEIGACGRCGRTLTRSASRNRGLGPDCAKLLGWS